MCARTHSYTGPLYRSALCANTHSGSCRLCYRTALCANTQTPGRRRSALFADTQTRLARCTCLKWPWLTRCSADGSSRRCVSGVSGAAVCVTRLSMRCRDGLRRQERTTRHRWSREAVSHSAPAAPSRGVTIRRAEAESPPPPYHRDCTLCTLCTGAAPCSGHSVHRAQSVGPPGPDDGGDAAGWCG